jgi:hypothetical protein
MSPIFDEEPVSDSYLTQAFQVPLNANQ